jgi:hypothetical protein
MCASTHAASLRSLRVADREPNCAQNCGESMRPLVPDFFKLCLAQAEVADAAPAGPRRSVSHARSVQDPDVDVRQSALFGLGVCSQHGLGNAALVPLVLGAFAAARARIAESARR